MKVLKIIFCILSCICVAASIFVGIFLGWEWFFVVIAGAAVFGGGMVWAKRKSDPPPKPSADFMNTDEQNEQIKQENEENQDK